jgi:trans-aconitate methyltransferase
MTVFRDEPLLAIIAVLEQRLAAGERAIAIRVVDPELGRGHYAGERIELDGIAYVHRGFRVWVDLAERLGLRLLTPRPVAPPLIELRFEQLAGPPAPRVDDPTEKYGAGAELVRASKLEDPGFVLDFADALGRIALPPRPRILELGVNTGDAFALICALVPALRSDATFVGIDHSASALAVARARFPDPNVELRCADLADLAALALPRFDLVLSIATLQSSGLDDRALLRRIVQDHLAPTGAVILGIPNCRYLDGDQQYGARMKNFRQPELGLLVKDVAFYRKYLQQHHRQVFVTGKNYLLVTGVASSDPAGS